MNGEKRKAEKSEAWKMFSFFCFIIILDDAGTNY